MGRHKTPTNVLEMRGSKHSKGRREKEPEVEPCEPERPEGLSAEAAAWWDRVLPWLMERQVLTVADGPILADYCRARARLDEAQGVLDEEGIFHTTPNGHRQPHPALSIERALQDRVTSLGARLGLSPSERTNALKVPPGETGNRFNRFKK